MTTAAQFQHGKQFVTPEGKIITVKAFVTIHQLQHVECYENNTQYKPTDLTEVHEEAEASSPGH